MYSMGWFGAGARRGRFVAALVALALCYGYVSVAVGRASTVGGAGDLVYTAEPGEVNDVTVERQGVEMFAVSWLITDGGAVIKPSTPCTSLDAHSVRCQFPDLRAVAQLGDGNDRLRSIMPFDPFSGGITADGGPGDDQISGGEGVDRLGGGGGRDQLSGGAGDDELRDGDGAGTGSGPDGDVLDGGPGLDTVSYADRTGPVSVDLANPGPVNGERGEGDRLSGFESVVGGAGNDRLAGSDADNLIDGAGGQDRLSGRGGNDFLVGAGRRISCGQGIDRVSPTSSVHEYLRPDCEWVPAVAQSQFPGLDLSSVSAYPVQARSRASTFSFDSCPSGDRLVSPCTVTLRIREAFGAHRLLARGRLPRRRYGAGPQPPQPGLPLNAKPRVRAWLTPAGRRLAGRRRGVRARVKFHMHGYGEGGAVENARWGIRLKLPR